MKTHVTLQKIQQLHQAGDLQQAKIGYLQLLEEDQHDVGALNGLALIYIEETAFAAAEETLQKLIALNDDANAKLNLANVYKITERYAAALNLLQEILQKHPDYAPALNNLGTIYYLQKNYQQAVQMYQQCLNLRPDYVDAYYNLGLAYAKLQQYSQAEQAFNAVLTLKPDHAGALFQIALLMMLQEKYSQALSYYQQLAAQFPYHFETQSNMATCYLKLGDLVQAEQHYLAANQINNNDQQVLFNLGVIAMQQQQLNKAIDFYQQVVALNADHLEAEHNLAFAYLAMQQKDLALLHFQQVQRLDPNNISVQHTINILTQKKDITTSPPDYVRALFNSYADHYDAHLKEVLQYHVPAELYRLYTAQLKTKKSLRILDLGCGTGMSGEAFQALAASLTGVDIAENMLALAKQKNIYDELIQSDILPYLQQQQNKFDLILAADVLVYYGELNELFQNVYTALTASGCFLFNVENSELENFVMLPSGRFAHRADYIQELAQNLGFKILKQTMRPLRLQNQRSVQGHIFLLQKGPFQDA